MTASARRKSGFDRASSLTARPLQAPVVSTAERPDGGLNVTVLVPRPRWARLLGGGGQAERTFGLDAYGREVFEACDGKRSVRAMVRRFAKAHRVSSAEAEMSVTAFLKTLLAKGVVLMEVDRPARGGRR